MPKILVVHYSRTGFTETVARQLAKACGADLDVIEEETQRKGAVGYLRSLLEAGLHLDTPIQPPDHRPSAYDVVVIGTPIWAWNVSSPVRSYIKHYRGEFRQVALFCTCGGAGQSKVLADMERLCGRSAIARLSVTDAEIKGRLHHSRMSKFANAVKDVGSTREQPAVQESAMVAPTHGR